MTEVICGVSLCAELSRPGRSHNSAADVSSMRPRCCFGLELSKAGIKFKSMSPIDLMNCIFLSVIVVARRRWRRDCRDICALVLSPSLGTPQTGRNKCPHTLASRLTGEISLSAKPCQECHRRPHTAACEPAPTNANGECSNVQRDKVEAREPHAGDQFIFASFDRRQARAHNWREADE